MEVRPICTVVIGKKVTPFMLSRWNRTHGRKVTRDEIEEGWLVHRTVKMRLEASMKDAQGLPTYRPRARPNLKMDKAGKPVFKAEPHRMRTKDWYVAGSMHFDWVPAVHPVHEKSAA